MFETRKRKFVDADQMYTPQRVDSFFSVVSNDLYEKTHNTDNSRKKAYVAIQPNVFFSDKRLWRIYAMGLTKRKGPNYEKQWVSLGIVQTVDTLTHWKSRPWEGIHEELLLACRTHVTKVMKQTWDVQYPLDKFFHVVMHEDELYLVFHPNETDYRFYKIHQQPQPSSDDEDYCEQWENWSDKWSIFFPLYTPSDICFTTDTLDGYLSRPKRNIREDRIQVCRDAVKTLMNRDWNNRYPGDSCFLICTSKKSVYDEMTTLYGKALPVEKKNKIDMLNRRKITRQLLYRTFQPDPVPKHISIHRLKGTFRTVAAFRPSRESPKWKVYRIGKKNIFHTSFVSVTNLREYTIVHKWDVEPVVLNTVRMFIRQGSHFDSLITDKKLGNRTESVVAKSPGV